MEFAANFTAIDFETASRRSDSACQLAAVRVRDGKIVNQAMWLIRPEPFFFAQSNIRIHGITPGQVEEEKTFGQLWPEIMQTFGDDCLVAHNASFDMGVLLACLTKHGQSIPNLQYTCTRAIARRVWPKRPRFGLKPLSDWLGVRFQHHDALEDSIACAKILLAAGIDRRVDSLESLEAKLTLSRGTAGDWGKQGPTRIKKRRQTAKASGAKTTTANSSFVREVPLAYQPSTVDLQRLLVRADFIRPLAGQTIVFSGKMTKLSLTDAQQLAARSGGDCQSQITSLTSILVLGDEDENTKNDRIEIGRQQQAAKQQGTDGPKVRILSELEFVELVAAMPSE
ncbi:exonuclease domain-containing protein [Planctomycetes bacterium K23_9]|uniref:DNA polymerase III PolC-type n=1 Tax=Stieleria marina TaxID=1930275 RepID=A0A517NYA5_9BACT|nr:DNA polymerase III PolC-type [Planctomycetes bacterium K23_9]